MPEEPKLTKQANQRANQIRDDFHTHLNVVAKRLAMYEGAENVLEHHVDEGFIVLRRAGLTARPVWWRSREFKIAAGFTLVGFSPSFAGLSLGALSSCCAPGENMIIAHPVWFWITVPIIPAVMVVSGLLLGITAFYKDHK